MIYPTFLMGTSHTYGVLGLSMIVLVVLTHPQWILNLPVVDRNPSYVLYEIPD